jgi:hypothetical protein
MITNILMAALAFFFLIVVIVCLFMAIAIIAPARPLDAKEDDDD